MERFIRLFSALLLVVLLFTASELGPKAVEGTQGRTCETKSYVYKGLCFRKTNCAAICQFEGFHSGHCRGFRRRCFCTKQC